MYEEKECSVCGKEILIRQRDDGSYENGVYWGEIETPTEEAEVIEKHTEEIEGEEFEVIEWSEYKTREMWECLECTNDVRKE